jgi:hypothetical protein
MRKQLARCAIGASLAAATAAIAAEAPAVPYPAGYRQWTHVKSMQILPGHPLYDAFGGIHHLYANAKAMAGYRSGRFPDGAVIVFDLLQADSAQNAVTEGPRKVVGVMHRDAKRYAATGGWGYEAWKGGDAKQPVVKGDATTACFNCHTAQKDHQYVFSAYRP